MKTHKTKNDLPSNAKSTVMGILNGSLASVIDLALVTKQAHWNLKGPQFIAVHELLDTFRAQLDNHGDTIAERVVQLGGTALGSLQSVSSTTKLKAYPTDIYKIHDHLDELIARYGDVANMIRKAIDDSDEDRRPDDSGYLHRRLARSRQGAVVPRGARSGKELSRNAAPATTHTKAPEMPGRFFNEMAQSVPT